MMLTKGKISLHSFIFEYRHEILLLLALSALPIIFFDNNHTAYPTGSSLTSLISTIGWLLIFAGIVIRMWAGLYIGGNKNKQLVRQGPYSLMRNPLYAGNLVSTLGLAVLSQSLTASLLIFFGFLFVYLQTIQHEEKKLKIFFGPEYDIYIKDVPRLVPRIKSIRHLATGQQIDHISYKNLLLELKRGGGFCLTGILIQLISHMSTLSILR